ncbi:MAG TPA: bifunctional methylenetetrahydrofolate dehydrogenase/methenyltetrahydrofolate cyclohydrolase FolD [Gemmataceae bacterium]|jgi:methylenetetrahydrofolate dehydrogenase (NADP+)/methenyltetrahydrofolate cyclohydrolase|nr:bifunctional methylenetetrahydrofolate dehydrogenase/methenyltetrahydrofolate cyclohydrolase FolD [Gemmataceae bacterium]
MPARLLDGKALAKTMQAEIAAAVAARLAAGGSPPGLATVLVGDDAASHVYVRNKRKACEQVGMVSVHHELPAKTSQTELLDIVGRLNADPAVHGILVQLPLPKQIDEAAVIRSIDPRKDVDAFHPETVGLLTAGHPRFLPCTPHGIQQLLLRNGVRIEGSHVVIVGRSNIVGKPLALLLMQKWPGGNATVTVAHTGTRDLPAVTRSADIVVVAIGRAKFLTADMVRPGAVVVDVGMNKLDGKLCGDVDFEPVSQVASAITPVPGGVGPMTITMLLHNTLKAAGG